MAKKTTSRSSSKPSGTTHGAKRIVEDQVDIRSRMHDLVRDALATGEFGTAEISGAVADAFAGVRAGLAKAVPADHSNILHQTFDGMSDALAASADSARKAIAHAKTAGRRISTGELKEFASTMKTLEEDFLSACGDAAQSMSNESGKYLDEIVRRAKTVGTKVAPAARDALKTAAQHAPDLAVESVKASGRAAAGVAGEFAMGVSGLLSGLGSALRGASKRAAQPASKSATKPASKSKPVAKTRSTAKKTAAKSTAKTAAKKKAKKSTSTRA